MRKKDAMSGTVTLVRRYTHRGNDDKGEPLPTYYGGGVPGSMVAPGQTVPVTESKANQLLRDFPDEWEVVPGTSVAEGQFEDIPQLAVDQYVDALRATKVKFMSRESLSRLVRAGFTTAEAILDPKNKEEVCKLIPATYAKRLFPEVK